MSSRVMSCSIKLLEDMRPLLINGSKFSSLRHTSCLCLYHLAQPRSFCNQISLSLPQTTGGHSQSSLPIWNSRQESAQRSQCIWTQIWRSPSSLIGTLLSMFSKESVVLSLLNFTLEAPMKQTLTTRSGFNQKRIDSTASAACCSNTDMNNHSNLL